MKKILKIGITGQNGFIGSHLFNTIGILKDDFEIINFKRSSFDSENELDNFVSNCDVIVHLAAINRHDDPNIIYNTNVDLVKTLISSLERTNSTPHVLISSSSQEERDNLYGKSKKEGRLLLIDWASNNNALVSGLIIPNVFGPFGTPFYNSVVATFSHQITNKITPKINIDSNLKLIYINELIAEIILIIEKRINNPLIKIKETFEIKVSGVLSLLTSFNSIYIDKGEIPKFMNSFELNLFNTFRSYMDIENIYPVKYKQYKDSRGSFVEILRSEMPGQISFSTTKPGVVRGNHFHTRKIERFSVVKGKALIQLRKIGTKKVFNIYLDGDKPAYVDMPIWYTHNIKNIGDDVLYTSFWINEPYNPEDTDTYFVEV